MRKLLVYITGAFLGVAVGVVIPFTAAYLIDGVFHWLVYFTAPIGFVLGVIFSNIYLRRKKPSQKYVDAVFANSTTIQKKENYSEREYKHAVDEYNFSKIRFPLILIVVLTFLPFPLNIKPLVISLFIILWLKRNEIFNINMVKGIKPYEWGIFLISFILLSMASSYMIPAILGF